MGSNSIRDVSDLRLSQRHDLVIKQGESIELEFPLVVGEQFLINKTEVITVVNPNLPKRRRLILGRPLKKVIGVGTKVLLDSEYVVEVYESAAKYSTSLIVTGEMPEGDFKTLDVLSSYESVEVRVQIRRSDGYKLVDFGVVVDEDLSYIVAASLSSEQSMSLPWTLDVNGKERESYKLQWEMDIVSEEGNKVETPVWGMVHVIKQHGYEGDIPMPEFYPVEPLAQYPYYYSTYPIPYSYPSYVRQQPPSPPVGGE